jgi:XRE family transcriptional regulator of biofilm formation
MLGGELKRVRTQKGVKQNELSKKVGITAQYLCAIENGRAKNPSVQIMKNLAAALDTTVQELFFN